jgi:hypothetical protein
MADFSTFVSLYDAMEIMTLWRMTPWKLIRKSPFLPLNFKEFWIVFYWIFATTFHIFRFQDQHYQAERIVPIYSDIDHFIDVLNK